MFQVWCFTVLILCSFAGFFDINGEILDQLLVLGELKLSF